MMITNCEGYGHFPSWPVSRTIRINHEPVMHGTAHYVQGTQDFAGVNSSYMIEEFA